MAWIWVGRTRGAYLFTIFVIPVWLGGKVEVVEEGLETDGGEIYDDEDDWLISDLGDWIVVDKIDEVMVKEGGFTMSDDCEQIWDAVAVREASSTNCWR